MSRFTKFFNNIAEQIKSKRYVGMISNYLPSNSKNWSSGDFLNSYEISLYTNRAITKRSEKVGEIEFLLKTKSGKVIENDPLINLLYKPNDVFTGRQFWGLWQKYYDILGEAYILIERKSELFNTSGKVIALHLLIPTKVERIYSKENPGKIEVYRYKTDTKNINYPAGNVIYTHNPDPQNPLSGISILKSGITAIQTEVQISKYHSNVLENGGKVEGIFKFKTGNLTAEQLKDVKAMYQKEYGSASKSGFPLFLGGDADYIKTGLSPAELSFLEAKKMTLEDICILTGVPKAVLGSFDDIQYSNAETANKMFLRETIKPLLTNLCTALDEYLFPDDRFLTFVDPTPENIEEKLKETESGIKNYYMTINEARERQGLSPIKNGDEIVMPFNLAPLGTNRDTTSSASKSMIPHPNENHETRQLWGVMQVKRMDVREKLFIKKLDSYFNEQSERLINGLQPTKTRIFRKENLFNEIMSISFEVKIGKEMFIPILTDLLEKAGIDSMEYVGSAYKFNISSDIVSWIDKKAEVFLRRINETTFEKLKSQFSESFANNESRDSLIKRVKDTYGEIKDGRANTIARTETHSVTQNGTLEGYKQAGLTTKIWVSVNDAHTRNSHASLDGEERPINMPFSNGLMVPGDANGPAEEVCNCRCVI